MFYPDSDLMRSQDYEMANINGFKCAQSKLSFMAHVV